MGHRKNMLIEMAESLADIVIHKKGPSITEPSITEMCDAARTAADLIELAFDLGDGDDGKDE
jgi:hypothetical protein